MGYDPVAGIGSGCQPGMRRLSRYLFDRFGGWDLGCYNPASVAGGGPSLHAEGRAQDFAFDARVDVQREAGDALFHWAIEHADEIGLQEILWRGFIWSWRRRSEGIRSGVQQGAHMNHVHLGVDRNAGANWEPSWLNEGDDMPLDLKDLDGVGRVIQDRVAGTNLDGSTVTLRQILDDLLRVERKVEKINVGAGLSADEVRQIVRDEIDKTRLAH